MDQQSIEIVQTKKYVQSYGKPNDLKAWLALGLSLVIQTIAVALIHYDLNIIGWAIHTLNCVRFFIQFHDMAHMSFFSSLKLNIFIGKILGVYTHFAFNAWRDGHNHHHKHFGNIDRLDVSQTILFTKKQYEQMTGVKKFLMRILRQPIVFFFITEPFVWFFFTVLSTAKRYGIFSLTYFEKISSIVIFTWILPMVGIPAWKAWFTIYLANVFGTILFHLQHSVNLAYRERKSKWSASRAALQGSTYLQIPFWLKIFTNGIEYHHIHHLNTNVPSYMIGKCHEQFELGGKQGSKWDDVKINRVDYKLAFKSLFNVMLDQGNSILIPFDYKFF